MDGCEARHDALIEALQADLSASDAPGVSAAVMEDGVVTCRLALGTRSTDSKEQPTVDTLFQIGSTTKMFTALGLLQRVGSGSLSLDMTLAEAYPDSEFALDESWNDALLLEHLLTHQGGFLDYAQENNTTEDGGLEEWYAGTFFPNLWLMAEPGSFWNYSNPNFDVAGLITEHDDGRPYPDIMLESVFGPLGMDRTMQRKTEVIADGDFAEGYGYYLSGDSYGYGPVDIDTVPDPASHRPAGVSTWSTPTQLMQMARFLINGDSAVLDDSLRQSMTTPHVSTGYDFMEMAYGYGVFVNTSFETQTGQRYPMTVWSHDGNTNSYSSSFWVVPEQAFGLSILSSGFGTDFSHSVEVAMTSLLELPAPEAVEVPVIDTDAIDAHVGEYMDPYNIGPVTITRSGDSLLIDAPLLEKYGYNINPELYGYSTGVWYLSIDGSWIDLTFISRDDTDDSRWIRNRSFVAIRAEEDTEERAAASSSHTPLDRAGLDQLLQRARVPAAQLPPELR